MIDDNVLLNGHGQPRIVVRTSQVIRIQPFGQLLSVNASIGIQGRFFKQLDHLIFLANIVSAMQQGVCDLVNCRTYRLHLAHAGADGNAPILVVKIPVHTGHIHNHIYYNSTAYDRSRKFRNFIGSSFALRRLSDRVCLEHDLSVIVNPKLHSKGRYLHYGQWLGENQKLSQKEQIRVAIDAALTERPVDFADFLRRIETAGIQVKRGRGGVISFLVPGQQRAARFRASTLGDGYGPEDVQAVIDGKAPTRKAPMRRTPTPRRVNLLIDIQERMRQGKGPAYERWAKVYNLKQMAAALQYLKEHQLFEYDDLAAKTDAATERFHTLAGDICTNFSIDMTYQFSH